jgi:hypothetical protein
MNESPGQGFDVSKLPPIDKADIEAVRSFLPGKLLGRTAALLSLVLLVVIWAGGVDWALNRMLQDSLTQTPAWLRYGFLLGLPVLSVAWQLVVEWRASRNRRQAQALAMTPQAVPGGYFRIGPYLAPPSF